MQGDAEPNLKIAFGLVLRRHRLERGLSQEVVSLESGVQRNFISLIETGQNQPTITTLFRLATTLEVNPSELIRQMEAVLLE